MVVRAAAAADDQTGERVSCRYILLHIGLLAALRDQRLHPFIRLVIDDRGMGVFSVILGKLTAIETFSLRQVILRVRFLQ